MALLLLGLFGLQLFGSALRVGLVADDLVLAASAVDPAAGAWGAFPAGTGSYFRPLVMLSLKAESFLFPEDPVPFHHLVNVLLHLSCVALLYRISCRLSGRSTFAIALALAFLVHPVTVTDAVWISGRAGSMATCGYLLALLATLELVSGRPRLRWSLLALTGAAVALLSKESGVTVAVVMALVAVAADRAHYTFSWQRSWPGLSGAALLTLAYGIGLWYGPLAERVPASPGLRHAFKTLLAFPLLLVHPNRQPRLQELYRTQGWLLPLFLAVGLVAGALAVAWLARRGRRNDILLLVLLAAAVGMALLPFALFKGGLGSRLAYLPLAVACTALAVWASADRRRFRLLAWLLVPVILLGGWETRHEVARWLQGWSLSQRYCQTLSAATDDLDLDREAVLVLGPPARFGDVVVFDNDLPRALAYFRQRRLLPYRSLLWLAPLWSDRRPPREGEVVAEVDTRRRLSVRVASPHLFFAFPRTVRPGARVLLGGSTVTVESVQAPGRVDALTVRGLPPDLPVVLFDGRRFRRLPRATAPAG